VPCMGFYARTTWGEPMNEREPGDRDPKAVERVLVVDDDSAVRGLVQVALSELGGLTVLTCGSGVEARSKASAFKPDLLLLDMQLPDTDGPTLATSVRGLPGLARTPGVLLTGRPEAARHLADPDGAIVAVLAKPFDPVGLADLIRDIWARHRRHMRVAGG